MTKQLHILNGFATYHLFKEAGIAGDVCVWDEILSEGPCTYHIANDNFWKVRSDFVSQTFGRAASEYETVIEHFSRIRAFEQYEELVLWYEYDLFCQVNLMALLSWLYGAKAYNKAKIQLICVGKESGYDQLVGLGQLPVRKYPELLENRMELSESCLAYADDIWSAYAGDDPRELVAATIPHPVFTYLSDAIQAHFKRFPDQSGLNEIEKELLSYIGQHQPLKLDQLVRHMLQWQHYYGFGDLQYYVYIKKLGDLVAFESRTLSLTDQGAMALKDGIDRQQYPDLDLTLGGSTTRLFYRNGTTLYLS